MFFRCSCNIVGGKWWHSIDCTLYIIQSHRQHLREPSGVQTSLANNITQNSLTHCFPYAVPVLFCKIWPLCALTCTATFLVTLCGLHFMYYSVVQIVSQTALRDASHTHCISNRYSEIFLQYCNDHWSLWTLWYFRMISIEEQEPFRKLDKRKNNISLIYIYFRKDWGGIFVWGWWFRCNFSSIHCVFACPWLRYQARNPSLL